jgi:peptide-methionine (S)-S-oxide reductase
MRIFGRDKTAMVDPAEALPGREQAVRVPERHEVLGTPMLPPFPDGMQTAIFGMGCFWGAEKIFWEAEGVYTTAVGYAGGATPNPSYEEVCSTRTGHAEVVLVVFDPAKTSYEQMLKLFWEGHDPTQGMRQGADVGTQYRSLILWDGEQQRTAAEASLGAYQQMLSAAGHGTITTELAPADAEPEHPFFYAEDYHQQYLAKNPGGYCPNHSTGVSCPIGVGVSMGTG